MLDRRQTSPYKNLVESFIKLNQDLEKLQSQNKQLKNQSFYEFIDRISEGSKKDDYVKYYEVMVQNKELVKENEKLQH